jgi:5-methylcytosine-specific restriction enzyme subunit McrC
MRFDLVEHTRKLLIEWKEGDADSKVLYDACKELSARTFLSRNKPVPYYKIHSSTTKIELEADYYIGADWVLPGKKFVYVAPKINTKLIERFKVELDKEDDTSDQDNPPPCDDVKKLNYLKMYMEAVSRPEVLKHSSDLLFIDWNAPEIQINQKEDLLTPFLVVQFLNLLHQIVRKGLKKSYYTLTNNLQSRVKGKILVGQNIKTNIVKNRLTNTLCQYQEFGIDSTENRFLKKVLAFVSTYIANNEGLFKGNEVSLRHTIGFCSPAFENVSGECAEHELKNIKPNVFYKEYKEAIRTGKLLLKRFAYNISNTSSSQPVSTPPFWIDMPRLFELYVYQLLLKANEENAGKVKYQFSTRGNYLDFLICNGKQSIVIDTKYKLHYNHGHLHSDIRQVAGYARLKKVLDEVSKGNEGFDRDNILPCLIIYPDPNLETYPSLEIENLMNDDRKINAYHEVFKLGVPLPVIEG